MRQGGEKKELKKKREKIRVRKESTGGERTKRQVKSIKEKESKCQYDLSPTHR